MSVFRLSVVAVFLGLWSGCNCARPPVQNTLKADGLACAADEECESSLCDKLPGKAQVCFRKCSAVCKAGDICTSLASNDRFACVPERPGLCQPCALNVDCPYPGDRCLELGGTKVCARDCAFDGQCPSSYRCADGTDTNGAYAPKQCQPTSGTCECTTATAGQTKPCTESNSIGTCTGVQTCKPPNGYDACSATVPTTESCNGRDDDCNGMTDENLGETTCGSGECRRTVSNCINGSPQICEPLAAGTEVCDEKDNNCNGVVDDGFDKSSLAHCGTCNTPCARANATPVCTTGTCRIASCNPGFVNADGNDANGCEYMCTVTGAEVCDGFDNNCNGTVDEGFSTVTDPLNCGQCGRACSVVNGHISTYACVASTCGIQLCSTGFDDCDQSYANGCEKNVSTDLNNCGSCNNVCAVANGTPGCASSACTVASCNVGFGNCNNVVADGCEVNTTTNVNHCSACGVPCPTRAHATSSCASSMCGFQCNVGFVDLDGLAATGCEYACTSSGVDAPDYPLFIDSNCDGVDGDASASIFVATTGADTNVGTRQSPKRTIGAAIVAADAASPKKAVLVATGTYAESVTMRGGVSVYGGYDANTNWSRAAANLTIISGGSTAVTAQNLTQATELQFVRVVAANATGTEANGDGRSSVAVRLVNSMAGLTVNGCDLKAGAGSAGAAGTPGSTGAIGPTGGNAGAGGATPTARGTGATGTCGGSGGDGAFGVNGTTMGNTGIIGGTVAGGGTAGNPGSGGSAGSCGTTSASNGNPAPPVTAPGGAGNPGLNAAAGSVMGVIDIAGLYVPPPGLAGSVAKPGGGGGGGGSGGGTAGGTNFFCTDCSGIDSGGGGGGGAGGCGGTPGVGGRGGGGSFAVTSTSSSLTLTATTMSTAAGGNGGNGGNGGAGGSGGPGGSGALGQVRSSGCNTHNGGTGATGATGGQGGTGGGGSGGPGGPSICVLVSGNSPATTGNTCLNGAGGPGGTGGSNSLQPAASGITGTSSQQLVIP